MKHCSVEPMCPCVAERLRRADAFEELARRAGRWLESDPDCEDFIHAEDDLINEIRSLIDAGMVTR